MATDVNARPNEPASAERTRAGACYRPNVDIREQDDELTLVADMPGVTPDGIDIHFEDGLLTVQGRVEPRHADATGLLLREYGIGDFYRTFRVSEQINPKGIHAECADGVLIVHLPKAAKAKPRRIEVRAGT